VKLNFLNAISGYTLICAVSATLSFAQDQMPASKPTATITIRLINSKNGKPITDETPNVWVGTKLLKPVRADSRGEIRVSIPSTESTVSFFGITTEIAVINRARVTWCK
jgi:hypothetical protein